MNTSPSLSLPLSLREQSLAEYSFLKNTENSTFFNKKIFSLFFLLTFVKNCFNHFNKIFINPITANFENHSRLLLERPLSRFFFNKYHILKNQNININCKVSPRCLWRNFALAHSIIFFRKTKSYAQMLWIKS